MAAWDFPNGVFLQERKREAIEVAIGTNDAGLVVLDFKGVPVAWLGFPPEKALAIAQGLTECAEKTLGRGK